MSNPSYLQTLTILSFKVVPDDMDVGNRHDVATSNVSQLCQHSNSVRWQRALEQCSRALIKLCRCIKLLELQPQTLF